MIVEKVQALLRRLPHEDSSVKVAEALSRLDARERFIIEQRLMTEKPQTLSELGAHYRISRERARQLEIRAKAKLKVELAGALGDLLDEFATCFHEAGHVVVCPVYRAGEAPIPGIDEQAIAEGLADVVQLGDELATLLAAVELQFHLAEPVAACRAFGAQLVEPLHAEHGAGAARRR
jgi:hypothetical protein